MKTPPSVDPCGDPHPGDHTGKTSDRWLHGPALYIPKSSLVKSATRHAVYCRPPGVQRPISPPHVVQRKTSHPAKTVSLMMESRTACGRVNEGTMPHRRKRTRRMRSIGSTTRRVRSGGHCYDRMGIGVVDPSMTGRSAQQAGGLLGLPRPHHTVPGLHPTVPAGLI